MKKEILNKVKAIVAAGSALAVSATGASAQIQPPAGLPTNATAFFQLVLNGLTAIAGTIALLFLVIGGIRYIFSGGDKVGVEQAREQITSAIIGLVIVFGAWFIITIVGSFLGIKTILTLPQ